MNESVTLSCTTPVGLEVSSDGPKTVRGVDGFFLFLILDGSRGEDPGKSREGETTFTPDREGQIEVSTERPHEP